MAVSFYQQNKNKFNKISALLTAETKKNSRDISELHITRKGYVDILPNQTVRLTAVVSPVVSPTVKIVEGQGKIFWCWEVDSGEVMSVQGRHIPGMTGDPQGIYNSIYSFLAEELDKNKASWKKTFRDGALDPYFPNGLDTKSDNFRDICNLFTDIFECRISLEREDSILKTIKNPNLYPIVWYNMANNGSYSVQEYSNYSSKCCVSDRTTVEVRDFESNIHRYIQNTVRFSIQNIDNWSVVGYSDNRFRGLGGTIDSSRY